MESFRVTYHLTSTSGRRPDGQTDAIMTDVTADSPECAASAAFDQLKETIFQVKDTQGRYNVINAAHVTYVQIKTPGDARIEDIGDAALRSRSRNR